MRYRLEALLGVRAREERRRASALGEARREALDAAGEAAALRARAVAGAGAVVTGTPAISELQRGARFVADARSLAEGATRRAADAREEAELRRAALAAAARARSGLERHRARWWAGVRRARARREEDARDDLAMRGP
ncbi:MAG: hypothetical protein U0229_01900 [Anaeromyxobacter sp.]